jgi:tetratricopeptide (TPR) repeat protein
LKENKVGEATQLLSSIAEEKTARAEQAAMRAEQAVTQAENDRKEAAIAYRNSGAIAALRDPKKSLEAYARAVELNPDDKESLYWHGWLSLLAGHLTAAEKSLAQLLKLASATGDQRGVYRANLRLGELAQACGKLAVGLDDEEKAKDIASQQAEAHPNDREWQRDLLVLYGKIGDVQVSQGDLTGALKSYNDDLAITERLAKSDPMDARGKRDLSICYEKIGDVEIAQGDLNGALKSYQEGLAIKEHLAQFDPDSFGWQVDLSVSYDKVGDVQEAQGNLAGALKSYSDSLAIAERLALMQKQCGDKAKARGFLRQGHAIMARLTKLSPDNAVWKNDLDWFEGQIKELGR